METVVCFGTTRRQLLLMAGGLLGLVAIAVLGAHGDPSLPAAAVFFSSMPGGRRRVLADALAAMLQPVRVDAGLPRALRTLAADLIHSSGGTRLLMACREESAKRAFVWAARRASRNERVRLTCVEVGPTDPEWFFNAAPHAWAARWQRPEDFVAIDRNGTTLGSFEPSVPPEVLRDGGTCLACAFSAGADWTGRLFVFGPGIEDNLEARLRCMAAVVGVLTPVVHAVHQYGQLRDRLAAQERSKLADVLHDGFLQSLIALELRVQALRDRLAEGTSPSALELLSFEDLLRREISDLRSLMQAMRPLSVGCDELVTFIADQLERFELETSVRILSSIEVERVVLPTPRCTALARLVREALTNIRKHSGARQAWVRLAESGGQWLLIVEDDGRGLAGKGPSRAPRVLAECARDLDGVLSLRRGIRGGLRIEVTFRADPVGADRQLALPLPESV